MQNATPTGQAAIAFDGVGDVLARIGATDPITGLSSGNGDRTLFFVVRYVDPEGANAGLVYGDSASNEAFGLVSRGWDDDLALEGWGSANGFDSDIDGPEQGWIVQSVVLDADTFEHFVNGELVDSGVHVFNTDIKKLVIGAQIGGYSREAQMDVAAALAYDRALTEAERLQIETYLQNTYIGGGVPNAPPIALEDNPVFIEDTVLEGNVLSNDSDPDGDTLSASLVAGPLYGALSLDSEGNFTYTPDADFNGIDSFTYLATDNRGGAAEAVVTLTGIPVDDPADANDDSYDVDVDTPLTVDAASGTLANDIDVDGDPFDAFLVAGPAYGALQLNADGSFVYTPDAGFSGTDTFSYGVTGGDVAQVVLQVSRSNTAPLIVDDSFSFVEDQPLSGNVLANDTDAEGDMLQASLVTSPANGTLQLLANGDFTYSPAANFNGTDSFTYRVFDGFGGEAVGTVELHGVAVDDLSIAVADAYEVLANSVLFIDGSVGLLANDYDIENDAFFASIVTGPSNGILELAPNGSFTYTPHAGFLGLDSFIYQVTGGNTATVTLDVALSHNSAPEPVDDEFIYIEDTVLAGNVLDNDTDPDGDDLTVTLVSGPSSGVLSLLADGSFTYTPDENANGPDSFVYLVDDGRGEQAEATVNLVGTPVNDPTQAMADAYSTAAATPLLVTVANGVLANDVDLDGALSGATIVTGPARGRLQFNPEGSFTYTPFSNFVGEDSFWYEINGSRAYVEITVGGSTGFSLDGFVDERVTIREDINSQTSGFQPISMAFLPDNRMLLLSKTGEIVILDPESGASSSYLRINNIDIYQERGLLDITIDPDFENNGYIYLYYTPNDPEHARISRFQHSENSGGLTSTASLASETVIWEDTDGYLACCHYGGGLDFGPDGKIWLTTSDKFQSTTPGETYSGGTDLMIDLTSTSGKVIRVNPDGSVPDGTDGWAANPWADPTDGNNDFIWAYGLRNPFRARWDLEYENFYIGEVGGNQQQKAHEDVHVASLSQAGAFYGWPLYEGTADVYVGGPRSPDPATLPAPDGDLANAAEGDFYSSPIWSLPHAGFGASLTGGEVYRGDMFPEEWDGVYFYGDYTRDYIRYLKLDSTGTQVLGDFAFKPSLEISGTTGEVVSIAVGNDGALYYAMIATGEVRRVVFESNSAPDILSYGITPNTGEVPFSATFTAQVVDDDGDELTYSLNLGDGSAPVTGVVGPDGIITVDHLYQTDGQYFVSLNISDGTHSVFTPGLQIIAGDVNSPPVIVGASSDLGVAEVGDVVTFSASVSDPDNDALTYTWYFGDGTSETGIPDEFGNIITSHVYADDGSYQAYLEVTDGLETAFSTNLPVLVGDALEVPVTNGLVLLLQADIKIGLGEGNTVVSWLDGSGNGNNLFGQGDPQLLQNQTPTGQGAIVFDGTGDLLQRVNSTDPIFNLPSGSEDRTVFFVVDYVAPEGVSAGIVFGDGERNEAFGLVAEKRGQLTVQGWGGDFRSGVDGVAGGFLVQSAVLSNNVVSHFRDGILIDTDDRVFNTDVQKLILGGEIAGLGESQMKVSAVLIYDRALTQSERQQVENFLQNKYIIGNVNPDPQDDQFTFVEDSVLVGNVLDNDQDADGDPLYAQLFSGPSHGSLILDPNGSFLYTPDPDYDGEDFFAYTVSDGQGGTGTGFVTLNAIPVDDPAVAVADEYDVFGDDGINVTDGGVLANDIDIDGGSLEATIVSGPANGTLLLNVNGTFAYTPTPGFRGLDSFTYQVTGGSTATVTLNVQQGSADPLVTDDQFDFIEDTPLNGNVLANDSDPDSPLITASVVNGPIFGTLVLMPDGSFVYTPDADYSGSDSFTYLASDGMGGEAWGLVSLSGIAVDDPAIANDDNYESFAGTPLAINAGQGILANDEDVEGDPFTATLLTGPSSGQLQLNPDGSFIYTANVGFSGQDSFTYEVTGGDTAQVFIDVIDPDASALVTSGLVAAYFSFENVTLGAGNNVAGWLDGSGRGNDLTATGDPVFVEAATPTGQPAIVFDGSGDSLQRIDASDTLNGLVSGNGDRTLFFVVRYIDAEGSNSGLVYGDGAANEAFGLIARGWDDDLALHGWGKSNDFDSNIDGPDQGWIVQSVVLDDDMFSHYLNGTLIDSDTHTFNTDIMKLVIGAQIAGYSENSQMQVAAALIYDDALTDAERMSVETYLQQEFIDPGFSFG